MDIFDKATQEKILKSGKPLLLIGKHGVGKTSVLRQMATNLNLKMHELNAATLDPFVHIVGIPVVHDGKVSMNPPKELWDAEMLFLDEINRSDTPTRNALFEIICDKSVNGRKLPNLKLVVAAMNPPEDGYQVDELDDAMDDRFLWRFKLKNDISYALSMLEDEKQIQAVKKWYQSLDEPPSPRRLTWALESCFEDGKLDESALLNALDDTWYGTTALIRMLADPTSLDAPGVDEVLSEEERQAVANILASSLESGEVNQRIDGFDAVRRMSPDLSWVPKPSNSMSMQRIIELHEGSKFIKDVVAAFPYDINLLVTFPAYDDGWADKVLR